MDEAQYENTIELIDRLMAAGRLTRGQELYLETLVQLVQAYETSHYAIALPTCAASICCATCSPRTT